MKDNQTYIVMSARKNRRFWLAAGTALLVWQVNNQTAQADVPVTPTSSAETTGLPLMRPRPRTLYNYSRVRLSLIRRRVVRPPTVIVISKPVVTVVP